MIIRARHNCILYPFFTWYSKRMIGRHFHSVHFMSDSIDVSSSSVLVLANHISWWDGFWIQYLNTHMFHKKMFFMMMYAQLQRFWFFKYTGGFSVQKGKKSLLETLSYASSILQNRDNMLLLFPQGYIQSMHTNFFEFNRGVEKIISQQCPDSCKIVFVANFIDYLSVAKPSVYIYTSIYTDTDFSYTSIEKAYTDFYNQSLRTQQNLKDV
ncbi:MAG: 1-acyl-sn-glycerol-3-phosphate acyltransferase [Bacteroidales bacterium]